jgi:hypothetical protein
MTYHDTHCPCKGRKDTDTLLCYECVAAAADVDLTIYRGEQRFSPDARRAAGIRLLAQARRNGTKAVVVKTQVEIREA